MEQSALAIAVSVIRVRGPLHDPLDCAADGVLPDLSALEVQLVGGALEHVNLLVLHRDGGIEQHPDVGAFKMLRLNMIQSLYPI